MAGITRCDTTRKRCARPQGKDQRMFEKLKQKLSMLSAVPKPFDPARFGDPVALQTAWTPAKPGGSSIRTHKLTATAPNRVEFRASTGAILLYLVFLLAGLAAFVGISASWFKDGGGPVEPVILVPLLVSLLFMAIGAYLLNAGTTPIVFEKGRGIFWKGRKGPDEAVDSRNTANFVRLDHVHAIQLIAEYISGKNSYYSYELNLVLEDGKRIPVIDHGNLEKIREDARTLALFLGRPLWDATIS
jgi:hypothetical protein